MKKKSVLGVVIGAFFLFSLICSVVVLRYEAIGTRNATVNLMKRIVAQSFYYACKIYDPYKKQIKQISTGFLPINEIGDDQLIRRKNELEKFLHHQAKDLRLILYENENFVKSSYPFKYEFFLNDSLHYLKSKYKLEEIIRQEKSEYQQQIKLGNWVNRQWKTGVPEKVKFNFDAIDIIDRGRKGETFFCSEYATTFVQCAISVGFQSRYVGLMGTQGHVVSEIWSNEFNKWYVIDNMFNVIYQKNGVPLNALEIHNQWCSKKWKEIEVVKTADTFPEKNDIHQYPYSLIDSYESFYIRMRNDWFSNPFPHWHPISNSIMNAVEYIDGCSVDSILIYNETSNPGDLYWDLNKTKIYLKPLKIKINDEKVKFEVYLDTITPDFKEFLVKVNGKEIKTSINKITWTLEKGVNSLTVTSVNILEKKGHRSIISILQS